jgi:hypothetical protein
MLEFPTFEQMVDALSSPISPVTSSRESDMELSTDDMIREMFTLMKANSQPAPISQSQSLDSGGLFL